MPEASDTLVAAVGGGMNRVVVSHILDGGPGSLTDLLPDLLRLAKLVLATHEP